MAAISKGQVIAGSFGKRLANQISAVKAKDPASIQRSSLRSVAYFSSSYDKNVDEHVRPAVVPDHVISSESDKYWCPHPKTGVFGPADSSSGVGGTHRGAAAADGPSPSSSVLDQTAWFRPLEDVQKPPPPA